MADVSIRSLSLALILIAPPAAYAQILTIPERVAAGKTETTMYPGAGIVGGIAGLLSGTELVVRGGVGQPQKTVLSEDQLFVLTLYPLLKPTVLYSRTPLTSSKPGPLERDIVIAQVGGTVDVNGTLFTLHVPGSHSLAPGMEGVFLLRRDGSRYRIQGGELGAFAIEGERLVSLNPSSPLGAEYRDMSAERAIANIVADVSK